VTPYPWPYTNSTNANLLNIPQGKNEAAIAYIDDALLLAIAANFNVTHTHIASMMTRVKGVIEWSKSHNSPLEYSKLMLMDFAHQNSTKPHPHLTLLNKTIKPTTSTKYLGVIFDQHLKWMTQHAYVTEKGSKWSAQICRATRPSWGVTPQYTWRLYISVALPRVLYAVDIWCTPPHSIEAGPKRKGSLSVIKKLTSTQRAGMTAIMGGLQTSPTDSLDACTYMIPVDHLIDKWCYRAAVRLATLLPKHPLHKLIKASANMNIKRHRVPLNNLMQIFDLDPKAIEKIGTVVCNPLDANKIPYHTSIPTSEEESKVEECNAGEVVKVYTDGSVISRKVGAAAILIRPGCPT
jgi:hypothetical protein